MNHKAPNDPEAQINTSREWLVTNGLGGYASGTVVGELTRRYHGTLIAAFPNPLGRTMMLNGLAEMLRTADDSVFLAGTAELMGPDGAHTVSAQEFHLEAGLPVWRYRFAGCVLEKRIFMTHGKNTVHVAYKFLSGSAAVTLHLRPGINFRSHDAPVETVTAVHIQATKSREGLEVSADGFPSLHLQCCPAAIFHDEPQAIEEVLFHTEESRGYDSRGPLWSPGYFEAQLKPGESLTLSASPEKKADHDPAGALQAEWERRNALVQKLPRSMQFHPASQLGLAADQFLIKPVGRVSGDGRAADSTTVIAGYHWFTDWGRDTMISLEGLTLVTGRHDEARAILEHFGRYIKDGLIPNMFPEGQAAGLYNTADATLWYFHALRRYIDYTGDKQILESLLPKLQEIIAAHVQGTLFNIHVDPADELLVQGEEGVQLTWMDAKVQNWVVTPRRGKAVEINALWYNALMNTAAWLEDSDAAHALLDRAQKLRVSFNQRFWSEEMGYLFDVIDGPEGNEPCCRPNQLFAISLEYPVLDESHWKNVVDVVARHLLTPVGLRSLAPSDPEYCAKYFGNLWSRDAAYHQGTVWGWLIGPYIDAWLKVHPGQGREAHKLLAGFIPHLHEAGLGSISEIFDADTPHVPRGCIAQAWSVAEVLRCWHLTSTEPC